MFSLLISSQQTLPALPQWRRSLLERGHWDKAKASKYTGCVYGDLDV
jgi:hypothetical protein